MKPTAQTIREEFTSLRLKEKMRHREIAERLQISEGELISAHVGIGVGAAADQSDEILQATRLRPDWSGIIGALESLGEVMALTRNGSCVHEKTGVYYPVSLKTGKAQNQIGLVEGTEISLRLFYSQWAFGFAVVEKTGAEFQRSLQFYAADGMAIHKIFLKPQSKITGFNGLVSKFAESVQSSAMTIVKTDSLVEAIADSQLSQQPDALLATEESRLNLPDFPLQKLLEEIAKAKLSIKIIVSNRGASQSHLGPINHVEMRGPWLNILDPGFNLHLRADHIATSWRVKKLTAAGPETILQIMTAEGETIATIAAATTGEQSEPLEWTALIHRMKLETQPC